MQAKSQGQDANNGDMYTLHQQLIDTVKAAGYITSPRVEEAFRAVPRHLFLPHLSPQEVYQDRAIMTKMIDGQYVSSSSQPTIMAIMLEQLDLQPGQRVLEIGAGTGYNAALMAYIVGEAGQVVTIDIDEDIVAQARLNLAVAGFQRVQVICADGGLGYPDAAPYDRIILTVSSAEITPAWREQLHPTGRFLLPLAVRGPQVSVAFEPQAETNFWQSVSVRACGFVGLRGAFADNGTIVQLSPDPQSVIVRCDTHYPVDAEHIFSLLKRPYRILPTRISVTQMELYWSLHFWLAVHEPLICDFIAFNEAAKSGLLPSPPSTTQPDIEVKMTRAIGLLSQDSLALLNPTLEATAHISSPMPESSKPLKQPPAPSLWLNVRSYGDGDILAQHLIEQLQVWNDAGHPDDLRLHIRSYGRVDISGDIHGDKDKRALSNAPTVGEHDIQIEGRWSRFIFNWQ